MSSIEAKIKFAKGEFEISGSEEFVSNQIAEFKGMLNGILESHLIKNALPNSVAKAQQISEKSTNQANSSKEEYAEFVELENSKGLKDYENVFAIEGDKIQIISDVPGNSTVRKMINIVLIYLWIKQKLNIQEVAFSELRDVCEKYGEIDKPNFAKYMKLHKKYFIINGSSKSQTAILIRPGIKEAEYIINQLNNSSN